MRVISHIQPSRKLTLGRESEAHAVISFYNSAAGGGGAGIFSTLCRRDTRANK